MAASLDLGDLLGWKKFPILFISNYIFPFKMWFSASYGMGPKVSAILGLGLGLGHNPKKVVVSFVHCSRILKTLNHMSSSGFYFEVLNTLPACDDLSFKITRSSSDDSIIWSCSGSSWTISPKRLMCHSCKENKNKFK